MIPLKDDFELHANWTRVHLVWLSASFDHSQLLHDGPALLTEQNIRLWQSFWVNLWHLVRMCAARTMHHHVTYDAHG